MTPDRTLSRPSAAELLGAAESASPEEARRAFLIRLAETEFFAPPFWRAALASYDSNDAALALRAREMAGWFWSRWPESRAAAVHELRQECRPDTPLGALLARWAKAAELPEILFPVADPDVATLAEWVRQLAMLPPPGERARRHALVSQCAAEPDRWRTAAQRLATIALPFARFGKALVEELQSPEPPIPTGSARGESHFDWQHETHVAAAPAATPVGESSAQRIRRMASTIAIGVFIGLCVILSTIDTQEKRKSKRPQQPVKKSFLAPGLVERLNELRPVNPPRTVPQDAESALRIMEELREIEAQREKAAPDGPPP